VFLDIGILDIVFLDIVFLDIGIILTDPNDVKHFLMPWRRGVVFTVPANRKEDRGFESRQVFRDFAMQFFVA
jgi:hypothetical protein